MWNVVVIIMKLLLLLVGVAAVGIFLVPRLSRRVSGLPTSQSLIAFTVVIVLLFGWAVEELGQMTAITGAFTPGWLAR